MRFSISASSCDQLAPPLLLRALARACPASRSGSVGGSSGQLAPDLRPAAAAASPAAARSGLRASSLASPTSISADGGSGEVARPARPRRRRPGWPARSPAPCSGASPERALTRITSSGVSWKTRLKPPGRRSARASSAACTATETPSAICSVADADQHARFSRGVRSAAAPAARRRRLVDVDRERQRAGGRRLVVVGSSSARRASAARRVVEARDDAGVQVERQQVDAAPTRTRTRAPRGRPLGAERAEHQRQRRRRAPGRPSSPSASSSLMPFCCR